MTKKSPTIGFLYINGLGYGKERPQERLMKWWWKCAGIRLEHLQTNWYDSGTLESKLAAAARKVKDMLQQYDKVAIIGTSAGGSLALNTFCKLKNKNVCLVNSHGRLKVGNYPNTDRRSMYRRARLGTNNPLRAFADSVKQAEEHVANSLTTKDKRRILTLDQLTDFIVPLETMRIEGTENHRSFTIGHSGGLIAHLIGDRGVIIAFAKRALT